MRLFFTFILSRNIENTLQMVEWISLLNVNTLSYGASDIITLLLAIHLQKYSFPWSPIILFC